MSQDSASIAKEIFRQLGGSKFALLTGAKFTVLEYGVNVRYTLKTKNKSNIMQVVLKPDDTYTVKFFWYRGGTLTLRSEYKWIYCDNLVSLFEENTGLYAF